MPAKTDLPTPKSFSLTFGAVFVIIGMWPLLVHGEPVRYWALGIAVFFVAAAFFTPRLLGPLNWLWFQFGLLLHRIVNPIVLTLIYVLGVLPIGLIMRALGKDPLRLKWQPHAQSYWITRDPPGPAPGSMPKQF